MIGRGTEETGTYHIRRHEHPLWKRPVHDVVRKVIERADALDAFGVLRYRIVDDAIVHIQII
jgi:hypothetical protein